MYIYVCTAVSGGSMMLPWLSCVVQEHFQCVEDSRPCCASVSTLGFPLLSFTFHFLFFCVVVFYISLLFYNFYFTISCPLCLLLN